MKEKRPPEVLESYLAFCKAQRALALTGVLTLETDFVFPTTLLPLVALMDRTGAQLQTSNDSVGRYVETVSRGGTTPTGSTYVPAIRLPPHPGASDNLLTRLEDLSKTTRLFSNNPNAYLYLLSELVDNIDQHARANHAYAMAQFYPKKGLIEASFMDDGVSISGSLEQGTGIHYAGEESYKAILDALGGASAKKCEGRGYGLRTSVRLANALEGQVLIVSGRGAVVAELESGLSPYSLSDDQELCGTLVSVRLREGDKKINFYDYLED